MSRRRHVNEFLRTSLNSGRIAGAGINFDDYSEESFPDRNPHKYSQANPIGDGRKHPDYEDGEVISYKMSKEELKQYLEGLPEMDVDRGKNHEEQGAKHENT